MLNEPGRYDHGPLQCPYCGTRLNGPTKFCPECGTNQLAAAAHPAAGEPQAHGFGPHFYTFASVAAFAVAFAAYGILHHPRPEPSAVRVQGSVAASQDGPAISASTVPLASHRRPASAPAGAFAQRSAPAEATASVAPAAAASSAARPAPAVRRSPEPSVTTHTYAAQTAQRNAARSQRRLADENAAAARTAANARADAARKLAGERASAARNLASARASLDKNDLGSARGALMTVLSAQPDNGEAQQMQSELVSREAQRDSLLGYARLCAREARWVCAWHNAGHALTVDASSQDARALLSRAIAEHGASHAQTFDPSLPGADH
jgi:hypothetical protein